MAPLDQGWIDTARQLHPNDRIYTFRVDSAAFRRNAGFRMDFLLVDAALATRRLDAQVDTEFRGRVRTSDHAQTWITLADV